MAKVTRILALLTIVALVAALPMSVVAQNDAPHVFIGTAIVNGLTATTGVPITAWDGDTQIGSTTVVAGGKFNLSVNRSSGRITFKIDNVNAAQSHPAWEFGGLETGFNLTATSQSAAPGARGADGADGKDGADGARGPQGPAGSAGTAGADGADGARGPVGPQGEIGAQGAAGNNGAAGSDGAAGPAGPAGPAGTAGAAGGGGSLGIIALIVAIIAVVLAVALPFVMPRR